MRRQRFNQEALGRRHVGIFDLILADPLGLGDCLEQRWPLIERDHAKVAIRVRKPRQAAVFSNRSH